MCNINTKVNSSSNNSSSGVVINGSRIATIAQRSSCPYDYTKSDHAITTTTTGATTEETLSNNHQEAAPKQHQQHQQRQKCVYGFVGSNFDNAIKPLLLLYLVGSALGTLFFATLARDATRAFILATCGHLLPEVILWTHMLFPPATTKQNHRYMWKIRTIYGIGFVMMCCWPVNSTNGKMGPVLTATYMLLSGVSDFLALWLGMVMVTRRTHHGVRRLGIAFFIHGAAFHLNAFEFFCPNKHQLWWNLNHSDTTTADGNGNGALQVLPSLEGMGWIILLVATIFAFVVGIIPLFREPLDLRGQSPSAGERRFLMGGVLTSFTIIPPLAAGGPINALRYLPQLLSDPTFFQPRSSFLAIPCKIGFPLMSLILTTHVLLRYVDSGLPILPLATQPQPQQQQQQASSSSAIKTKTNNFLKQ